MFAVNKGKIKRTKGIELSNQDKPSQQNGWLQIHRNSGRRENQAEEKVGTEYVRTAKKILGTKSVVEM